MSMPAPTEHHDRLEAMVGTWRVEETMAPSPWDPVGGPATATSVGRRDLDGMHLIVDYQQTRDGGISFRGHGVYGWDPTVGCYTMYWFDSMGFDPGGPAQGTWEGDTLTFVAERSHGHSRYVYTFEGPDRFRFHIEMSPDGSTWSRWLDSVYTRA